MSLNRLPGIANPQNTKRLGHFLTTDCKSVETPNGKKHPYLQQAVLAANASIQLIYREYQIPILSPNNIAELYLELLEFIFIQVRVILRMRMLPDKSTHIYCLNGTIIKVQFNL